MTTEQLNALQEAGIISDNCITWNDVAEPDRQKALEWIEARTNRKQSELL